MSDTIVIEIPAHLKSLSDSFLELVAAVKDAERVPTGGRSIDYLAVESKLAAAASKIERSAHERALSSLAVDCERIVVRGKRYTRIQVQRGCYHTQAGDVFIDRPLYREEGCRNGETVDPIALRVGAIGEGWLPGTARAMGHLLQQGTSRESARTASEMNRLPYSRSSFERVAHDLAEAFVTHQAEIEEELIGEYQPPEEAKSISASIDRVSVPMEEPRSRPVGRPRKNAPKRPVERNFRMAWCGTVTLHGEDGEALHTIRYGRMPQGDSVGLAEAIAADVIAMTGKRDDLKVMLLADGAHELWELLESELNEDSLGRAPDRLVDFWHLFEKLAAAAKVIHGDDARKAMKRWRNNLREKTNAAIRILGELRESGCDNIEVGDTKPVHEAMTYLQNHYPRMNYAKARRAKLPIGSGNVEATCKSLVGTRMKRPGSRWKETTGNHIMQLRATALSDRWDGAMRKLFDRTRTPVQKTA